MWIAKKECSLKDGGRKKKKNLLQALSNMDKGDAYFQSKGIVVEMTIALRSSSFVT